MKTFLALLASLLVIPHSSFVIAQGPLTPPPGAPVPTMKTLQQIEPRTDVASVAGDASYHHIITAAGSYYLTGNLGVTRPNGIVVRAEGVTIDLNGFEIRRISGTGGFGIEVDGTAGRCTVKNGSLKGFTYGLLCSAVGTPPTLPRGGRCLSVSVSGCSTSGIRAGEGWQLEGCTAHDNPGTGIYANTGSTLSHCTATANGTGIFVVANCTLSNCTSASNTGAGISIGNGSTVTNCSAMGNTGSSGISAGDGSSLTNCSAMDNTGTAGIAAGKGSTLMNCSAYSNNVNFGIDAGSACTLKNCTARYNTASVTASGGIDAGLGSTLIGCVADTNLNTNATASTSAGFGIRVSGGSTVRDCTVEGNKGSGIQVIGDWSQIIGNTCTRNTTGGQGAGIHIPAAANGCRIDSNHCGAGTRGIWVEGIDNLIIRNSTQGTSVLSYDIAAGNHSAAIINGPGLSFASTSPWANFRL